MPPIDPHNQPAPAPIRKDAPPPAQSSAGPIVGIVIVILLLMFGALYFWGERLNRQPPASDLTSAQ